MRFKTVWLPVLLVATAGCNGHSGTLTSTPSVSGAYEFVVTSDVTGGTTLVEANLVANGNKSSATGPAGVQVLTLESKNWYVNGICYGTTPGRNSVTADTNGSNIALIFDDGGMSLSSQGVLTGATITGNYAITGSSCPNLTGGIGILPESDYGGVVGNLVPQLAGTFSGYLNLNDGTDNAALTLTESNNYALTVIAQLTGPVDNGTFTFTGSAVGNIMFVSGSVNGQALSLFGYVDRTGAYTGMNNSVVVFDYNTLTEIGLLVGE
ncbi:MAG: hypothetical protein WA232_17045 [Candidatus Sulfotelmatobacter sp.]